jgi:hypothetical protein
MSISVLAAEEHKSESKPAEHASHPSNHGQSSHAPQAHAAPSHPSGGGHAASPNRSAGQNRPSEERNVGNRTQGNRPQGNAGNRPGGNMNRPANGNRGNVGGNRNGNGNPGGNRGAMANRGNTAGSRSMAAPGRTVSLRGGGTASVRPNGQIRSINRNGMQINNGLHGNRTIVSVHNNTTIVNRGGGGYVQHPYMTRGGVSYYSRTSYYGGGYHVGIYRGYYWGGHAYYGYYPGVWFHPGFYAWGFRPWGAPVYWGIGVGGWGWGGAPWFGYYGGWWNPYPVYASPAFWLTDYLLAADLQAAYASRADANAAAAGAYDQGSGNYPPPNQGNYDNGSANSGQVTLSPEVKEAIAEEVKAQLAEQQQQAASQDGGNAQAAPAPANGQVPPALDPARRTFVVDTPITLVSNGQECELTSGDVITRLTDTPDADQKVNASVSASKKGECGAGQQVAVSVDDLQEMHNHFEEQLNDGLKTLAQKQGTNGMPKAPDTGTEASAVPVPQPDETAAKQLADQQAQADQVEAQAKQDVAGGGGQ